MWYRVFDAADKVFDIDEGVFDTDEGVFDIEGRVFLKLVREPLIRMRESLIQEIHSLINVIQSIWSRVYGLESLINHLWFRIFDAKLVFDTVDWCLIWVMGSLLQVIGVFDIADRAYVIQSIWSRVYGPESLINRLWFRIFDAKWVFDTGDWSVWYG